LGERATTEQVTQCLAHEPSIKYNKHGTVKGAPPPHVEFRGHARGLAAAGLCSLAP
jgi:hypothetical protein